MTWLTDPFYFDFFEKGLLAGVLVGAMCGALGTFVILRRMSYIGLGLSYSILGGVAVGFFVGIGLYGGAAAAALLAALLIAVIGRQRGISPDAAIGIVSSSMFALGVAVLSANRTREVNLQNLLFGNILGVQVSDLQLLAVATLLFFAVLFVIYKQLVFMTFDREVASTQGVRTAVMESLFSALIAAVVVSSLRVMGVLLIAAILIIPAAAARILSRTFGRMLVVAAGIGMVTSVAGLYISYYADIASGPAIVLSQTAVFAVALVGALIIGHGRLRSARVTHRAPVESSNQGTAL
jgi:ABC-type Mn2+/Zn2+ transport system permease subunit